MSFFGEVEKWGQALRDLHKLTPSSALDDAPHPQSMLQQKMGSDHYSSFSGFSIFSSTGGQP